MPATSLKVIPTPKQVVGETEEGKFHYSSIQPFFCAPGKFEQEAKIFAEAAKKIYTVSWTEGCGGVELIEENALRQDAYRLEIHPHRAKLFASGWEGVSYGLATLLQIMEKRQGKLYLPQVTVEDHPDCAYRTLMIDLARKWHEFEAVLGYVDLCYLYKIKNLHLHFMDIQSCTLPSETFPRMSTPGRHYTKEQIAQLNAYAMARGVELIPEIEVPGHARAMVEAYPELFAVEVENAEDVEKVNFDIISVGRPGVMDQLRKLVQEVMEMFPYSRYLHIGGDEAKIQTWESCVHCKKYMQEQKIDGVRALYSHFIQRMTDMVLSMGRTPVVWEGFPKEGSEGISRKVVVIAWESLYQLAPDLLEGGFSIVNGSWKPLYIVPLPFKVSWGEKFKKDSHRWGAEEILAWNIYNWQNWWKKSPAHLNPIHVPPTDRVLGGQLSAWECTYEQELPRVKENLAALSERTWNIVRYLEDDEFRTKLYHVLRRADKLLEP